MWAKLPGLESNEAKVVWVEAFLAGCAFKQPIDERVFKTMLWSAHKGASPQIVDRRSTIRAV